MGYFFYAQKIKFIMSKSLINLQKNKQAKIEKIEIKDNKVKLQLKNLGFEIGEEIKLLNYNYNKTSYLIKVMGVNYAIDKTICENIFVDEK